MESQPNNPLHGKTLEMILKELHAHFGWDGLRNKSISIALKAIPALNQASHFFAKHHGPGKKLKSCIWSFCSGREINDY